MNLTDLKGNKRVLESMVRYLYTDFETGERTEDMNDVGYTQEDISECGRILDEYIDGLIMLEGSMADEKILDLVEKVVKELNALNEKCETLLIETDQREELVPYIISAAELAGLKTDTHDITEQWREW